MKSSNIIPVVLIAMSSLTAAAQDQDQGKYREELQLHKSRQRGRSIEVYELYY